MTMPTTAPHPAEHPAEARQLLRIAAVAIVATAGLVLVGDGPLAPPPVDVAGVRTWAATGDPLLRLAALGRLVAIAVGGWTVATALSGALVRRLGWRRASSALDRVTPALVRRVLRDVGSVSVATSVTLLGPAGVALAATEDEPPPARATMVFEPATTVAADGAGEAADDGQAPAPMTTPPPPAPPATASPMPTSPEAVTVTETEGAPGVAATPTTAARPSPDPARPAAAPPAPRVDPPIAATGDDARRRWTVVEGDHLWGIAVRTLADAGVRADEDVLVDYWLDLIGANRDRLVDPSDPDLLHVGQVLVLPPPPT